MSNSFKYFNAYKRDENVFHTKDRENEVTARECRFAIHIPAIEFNGDDYHLVKEIVHYKDGSMKPHIRYVRNFERDFYVTAPRFRTYTQKKEEESLDKLIKYTCTQSQLRDTVSRALDKTYVRLPLQKLAASPYLYGSDVSSTSIIKHHYRTKYPNAVSNYNVAILDIETDMLHGTDDPIMITIVYKTHIYTGILKSTLASVIDPLAHLRKQADIHLGSYIEKDKYEIEFDIVDTPVDLIKGAISRAHKWSPDFLAIWNIDFDIPRILKTLEKYGYDAKDIFCDPAIPPSFRYCRYKKGSTKKITASGLLKPKNPSEQWHSLLVPASFWCIDAMSSYRFIRQGAQELPTYKLNYILDLQLGLRKLNFKEADHIPDGTPAWHSFMQEKYPVLYAIYNIFDCIGVVELDKKTRDLQMALPVQVSDTDFTYFNSQTKRYADDYHFYLLEQGYVVGTIPPREDGKEDSEDVELEDEEGEDENPEVLSLREWIVALASHLSALGKPLVKESPHIYTQIRTHVYDSDAVSAYPSCTSACNVSKTTTVKEIVDIEGIDEHDFRRNNMNLLLGHVNALEYATQMYSLPTPKEALALFSDIPQKYG